VSQSPAPPNPAQVYEDCFVTYQLRPWTADLLARARPQPNERVLDLACGTGIVARTIAHHLDGAAHLTGLDLSPAMIEVGCTTAAREGAIIAWQVGAADALPFPDEAFDLVTIQQGLQFFLNPAAALQEVHRVLVPGGRLVSAAWTGIANNPVLQSRSPGPCRADNCLSWSSRWADLAATSPPWPPGPHCAA